MRYYKKFKILNSDLNRVTKISEILINDNKELRNHLKKKNEDFLRFSELKVDKNNDMYEDLKNENENLNMELLNFKNYIKKMEESKKYLESHFENNLEDKNKIRDMYEEMKLNLENEKFKVKNLTEQKILLEPKLDELRKENKKLKKNNNILAQDLKIEKKKFFDLKEINNELQSKFNDLYYEKNEKEEKYLKYKNLTENEIYEKNKTNLYLKEKLRKTEIDLEEKNFKLKNLEINNNSNIDNFIGNNYKDNLSEYLPDQQKKKILINHTVSVLKEKFGKKGIVKDRLKNLFGSALNSSYKSNSERGGENNDYSNRNFNVGNN